MAAAQVSVGGSTLSRSRYQVRFKSKSFSDLDDLLPQVSQPPATRCSVTSFPLSITSHAAAEWTNIKKKKKVSTALSSCKDDFPTRAKISSSTTNQSEHLRETPFEYTPKLVHHQNSLRMRTSIIQAGNLISLRNMNTVTLLKGESLAVGLATVEL